MAITPWRALAGLVSASLVLVAGFGPRAVRGAGDDLRVLEASALATVPGATTGAVYVTVHNVGARDDVLLGAATPAADRVEMHSMAIRDGLMQMRTLPSISLPVGGSVDMGSGGTHLMLLGLRHPLLAGQHFPLTLRFAHAGAVRADVLVMALGHR